MVARLRALLGGELVGVYAGGSFALGGYEPGRSDLDIAAVCRGRLSAEKKVELAAALRHESLPCPAGGLELVVYAESSVRTPTAEACYELDLNTGRAMPFRLSPAPGGDAAHWYAIDRAILREHGVALVGPPASELFARIPRKALLERLTESVRWYREHPEARGDDAILNACRAWRFAREGVWSSKPDAGEWARARLDDPHLVAQALAARHGDGRLARERVDAFLVQIERLLEVEATRSGPVHP